MARTVDPEKHAARRRHILDRAAGVFAEHGYERATTQLVCSAAGVSAGSLYHYFRGKRGLFIAVLTDDEQDTAALVAELRESAEPLEALFRLVDQLAQPAAAHPAVSQLVLEAMVQARHDDVIRESLERVDAAEREGLTQLVRRAMEAGEADLELAPDEAASWISTMVGALYLDAAVSGSAASPAQLENLRRSVLGYLTVGRRA